MWRRLQRFLLIGGAVGLGLPTFPCVGQQVATSRYLAQVWGVDSGLPYNTVTSIAQTPDGYIWVGTLNGGLARFDGVAFTAYHPGNTPELTDIEIRKLLVDAEGTLWVGTVDGGVTSYRDGRFQFEYKSTQTPDAWLDALISVRTNEVRLASVFGWIFRGVPAGANANRRWDVYPMPQSYQMPVYEDRAGRIWYRTRDARLGFFEDGQFTRMENPPGLRSPQINALAVDKEGTLWVGTEREMAAWDGTRFVDGTPTDGAADVAVRQLVPAPDGALWVRTNTQLRRCAGRRWTASVASWPSLLRDSPHWLGMFPDAAGGLWVVHYGDGLWHIDAAGRTTRVGREDGLPNELFTSFYEDREGNVWLGLSGGGLARVRPRVFYSAGSGAAAPTGVTRSVCQSDDDAMWFGSVEGWIYQGGADRLLPFPVTPKYWTPIDIVVRPADAGRIWVGSVHGGVMLFEKGRFEWPFPPDSIGTVARALHVDRAGALWIGNDFGLFRWAHGELKHFSAADGFSAAYIVAIAESKDGALWMGTAHGELRRFHAGRFETFRPPDSPTAQEIIRIAATADPLRSQNRGALSGGERFWALHVDEEDVIWIGTLSGGLLRFEKGVFKRFTSRMGLPSDHVSQILGDHEGRLWLGTHNGIVRVDRTALSTHAQDGGSGPPFVVYGRSAGLPTMECLGGSQPLCWRSRDGRLWFTTSKGVVWVDPRTLPQNTLEPSVILEEIRVDGRTAMSGGRSSFLRVPPGRHYFEFRFTAPSFVAPDRVRFQWQLTGLEKDWVEGGSRRSVSYAFLPPGDYEFRVRACNNDGVWNTAGARVHFAVMPYIWQTWWFRWGAGGAGFLLLLGAVLLVQRRRYHARMRELERQHALERDRTRIARDIHDQVGAHLTRMGMQTRMLNREAGLPETCRPLVQGVAETTHQMLQSMDEIVWAINPRNDTLDNVVNYLVHYTREFLRPADIPYKLDLPMDLPERPFPAEVRHNFFMAFKEALNNAVKHGRPRHIRLSLALSAEALVFTVADDGAGFAPGTKTFEADGLENMRQRMQAVGGSCQIESAPGHGTRVVFRLPLSAPAERNTHIHAG